jgi:hypothetical protein
MEFWFDGELQEPLFGKDRKSTSARIIRSAGSSAGNISGDISPCVISVITRRRVSKQTPFGKFKLLSTSKQDACGCRGSLLRLTSRQSVFTEHRDSSCASLTSARVMASNAMPSVIEGTRSPSGSGVGSLPKSHHHTCIMICPPRQSVWCGWLSNSQIVGHEYTWINFLTRINSSLRCIRRRLEHTEL